jgi:quercetin dioxygenase-like cupin family protein
VATIPLPAPYDKQTATLVELYLAPGEPSSAPHRHPGFVLGYVIEGEFRFQIAGEPARTVRAGETFYEPPGAQHLVSASAIADRSARVLAIVIAEAGHAITEPV